MPPTNRDAFRLFLRRAAGIDSAKKAANLKRMGLPPVRMVSTEVRGDVPQVFAFGDIWSDDIASWLRDGPDDIMSVTSPGSIAKQLETIPKGQDFDLLINSDGGDVAAASVAGEMVDDRIASGSKVHVRVVGDALSAATTLMLRNTSSEIAPMGMVMIHNPWTFTWGDADALDKEADTLRKIEAGVAGLYASRTPYSQDEAREVMKAETWYNAEETVAAGLLGKVSEQPTAESDASMSAKAKSALTDDLNDLCVGHIARRSTLYGPEITG